MNDESNLLAQMLNLVLSNEPNWFTQLLIGVILGLLVPSFLRLLMFPIKFMRPHVLKGEWWEYHYSAIGDITKIFEAKLKISPGFKCPLVFKMCQEITRLEYKGKLIMDKGTDQFILLGNSTDPENEESIIWRYYLPVRSKSRFITGIITSYNHDKKPYASTALLCKERIQIEKASDLLKSITNVSKGLPVIRVKKSIPVSL